MAHGGFWVKIMVRYGESRPEVLEKFGGHVLGLQWDPKEDVLFAEMPVNFSVKIKKICQGPNVTIATINIIRDQTLTKRIILRQIAGAAFYPKLTDVITAVLNCSLPLNPSGLTKNLRRCWSFSLILMQFYILLMSPQATCSAALKFKTTEPK